MQKIQIMKRKNDFEENELQELVASHKERFKQDFLEDVFNGHPEDARAFEIEDIEGDDILYPYGDFCVRGFYHYMNAGFRVITTFRDGEEKPWVSVILYSHEYQFRSMQDAIAFCKNYRRRQNPELTRMQANGFQRIDEIAGRFLHYQIVCLSDEDKELIEVKEYSVMHSYEWNYCTLTAALTYKGTRIEMASSFFPDAPEESGAVEFRVNYKMKRELSSLYEAIEFLKTDPEYIEPLDEFDRKQSKKK